MTEDVKNADANAPKKLSIQRRTKTTVSSTTAGGKAKAVQVEVRKKRVFMKNPQMLREKPLRQKN